MQTDTKYGEFTVPIRPTHFGDHCDIRLSGLVLVMFRGTHGWKTGPKNLEYAKLSHQIYTKYLEPLIKFGTREIVAIDLHSGEWQTIWASDPKEVSHP